MPAMFTGASLPGVDEDAALGLEPHLDLAAAGLFDLTPSELRMLDPLARGEDLLRRVRPGRPRRRGITRALGRHAGSASSASRRGRSVQVLLLVVAVLAAAGTADDGGGDAVCIQGDYLVRAFGFAPPAVRFRVVAGAKSLDSEGCGHVIYQFSRARLCEPCAQGAVLF